MIGQHLGQRFAGARGLVQQRFHAVFRHVAKGRAKSADKQPGFDKLVSVKVHAGTMADGSNAAANAGLWRRVQRPPSPIDDCAALGTGPQARPELGENPPAAVVTAGVVYRAAGGPSAVFMRTHPCPAPAAQRAPSACGSCPIASCRGPRPRLPPPPFPRS